MSVGPRLGILDFGFREGGSSQDRLTDTIDLARQSEQVGYHRFWLTEHHGDHNLAYAAPEVLIPALAASTASIRVGVAGILLRLYSPMKVAETFRLLHTLFPGRIDLGFAGGGVGPASEAALLNGLKLPGREAYEERVREVVRELRNELESNHPLRRSRAAPTDAIPPELWVLGSGPASMPLAAGLGVNYCQGLFLGHADARVTAETMSSYRRRFVGNRDGSPTASVAVGLLCSETVQEVRLQLRAHRHPWILPNVAGTPDDCAAHITQLAAQSQAQEIVVAPLAISHEDRTAACSLLAKALKSTVAPALQA